ncbi:MAG: hypothetical protein WCA19_14755 [Candidatus Acidiferrales bacterium]
MPYGSTSRFRHQEVRSVPAGYKVRTVRAGAHQVRVAFPPGARRKGDGIVVGILHPKNENPCPVARKNPAELLLMGANPSVGAIGAARARHESRATVYDSLSVNEKLAFGRIGLGKAQIQTGSDLAKARQMVKETQRLKNRLPNPPPGLASVDGEEAEAARDLREGFSGEPSKHYYVTNEPHVPIGDYSDCGEFIEIAVKPMPSGETDVVQGISFPGKDLEWICEPFEGRQLYIVGGDHFLSDTDLRIFTASHDDRVLLGECRVMSYGMIKFGNEVPVSARGEDARWDHKFGEEGGTWPPIWYDRKMQRLILGAATYRIQGSWVRN